MLYDLCRVVVQSQIQTCNWKLLVTVKHLASSLYLMSRLEHVFYILNQNVSTPKVKVEVKSFSCVRLSAIPWTVVYWDPLSTGFSGKSTGVGCHFLFQGILPTQESNTGFPHCRRTHYRLSHQGSTPKKTSNYAVFSYLELKAWAIFVWPVFKVKIVLRVWLWQV